MAIIARSGVLTRQPLSDFFTSVKHHACANRLRGYFHVPPKAKAIELVVCDREVEKSLRLEVRFKTLRAGYHSFRLNGLSELFDCRLVTILRRALGSPKDNKPRIIYVCCEYE